MKISLIREPRKIDQVIFHPNYDIQNNEQSWLIQTNRITGDRQITLNSGKMSPFHLRLHYGKQSCDTFANNDHAFRNTKRTQSLVSIWPRINREF